MRRQLVDFSVEAERRNRLNLYSIARIGRKPELSDVETKLISDLSYRRETVIALDCGSENYEEALLALSEVSYLVMLDPPFDEIWNRMYVDPGYAQLTGRLGRAGIYNQWRSVTRFRDEADLLITDPRLSMLDVARLVLHCFFT